MFKRRAAKIVGDDAISELLSVTIGNLEQWLYLRGKDRKRPLLLMLHGGPGAAQIGFNRKFQFELEEHFVVIQWDQRGAGLSYSKHVPKESMHIDQFVQDTIEVTCYILEYFNRKQLYMIGHSWGSLIGMLAISRAPQLFRRYFGVSQVTHVETSDTLSYEYLIKKAKERHNEKAYETLIEIGPPPWKNLKHDRIHQKYTEYFGGGITRDGKLINKILRNLLTSKEYTWLDCIRYFKGLYFSMDHLQAEMVTVDLKEEDKKVGIPVYFLMGKYDLITPYEPTEKFFNMLEAPVKEWVLFENSAHTPILEEPEKFLKFLLQEVEKDRGECVDFCYQKVNDLQFNLK